MTKKYIFQRVVFIVILLFISGNSAWAQTVPREAQKHMNRGMVAVEMAKSPAGYNEAIREFEQAAILAPRWPAPHFNLGYVLKEAGKYQKSLANYRKYLELAPNAPDAAQVQTEIDQIEYKLEKASETAKIQTWLEGEWNIQTALALHICCWPVTFIVDGDSIDAYMPTTRTMGTYDDKYTDYKTISIKQEGRKIQFSVVLKIVGVSGPISMAKGQYNLNLITSDKMIGTIIFNSKRYNSDGSIWEDKNGTKKTSPIKQKHSDNWVHKSLMR